MPVRDVQIPKMGMSSTEVDIVSWLVKKSDQVDVGTPLVEIESEKASTIIKSPVSGIVSELLIAEGEVAEVGSVICRIDEAG